MTARGLDHLVLAVRDLDAAGAFYERLGFKVGGRNRHPWGTENRIVQFPGTFLELITVSPGAEIPPHAPGRFSFGAFVRDALAAREGMAMLVLESKDAAADNADFARAGIGGFETFFFERKGARPDGTPVEVAFTLAFAENALAPEAGFFCCMQHRPENFWSAEAQAHTNGVQGVSGIVMIAENPSDHADFLSHFTGIRDINSTSAGILLATPRGEIEVRSAAAWRFESGLTAAEEPTRFVGFRVKTSDLSALANRLTAEGIAFENRAGKLVVPPEAAFGCALVFES